MPPKQRILAIKLTKKIKNNPEYSKNLGIELKNKIINIKEN